MITEVRVIVWIGDGIIVKVGVALFVFVGSTLFVAENHRVVVGEMAVIEAWGHIWGVMVTLGEIDEGYIANKSQASISARTNNSIIALRNHNCEPIR